MKSSIFCKADGFVYDIRNDDGRLVCRINESTETIIEIRIKGCTTQIKLPPGIKFQVVNIPR